MYQHHINGWHGQLGTRESSKGNGIAAGIGGEEIAFWNFPRFDFSLINRCQLRLKHTSSGNFIFTYGFCSTVLIALTLSHEQIHILSPLPILISLLSTGRNVFSCTLHHGFSLPLPPPSVSTPHSVRVTEIIIFWS
jgi:hypothetical protein